MTTPPSDSDSPNQEGMHTPSEQERLDGDARAIRSSDFSVDQDHPNDSGETSPTRFVNAERDNQSHQEPFRSDSGISFPPSAGDSVQADPDDEDSPPLPENIGGYQVGKRLGRGGMGEVFLAEHRSMGRTVALKILPMRWINRSRSVDRFYDEIRAASKLMHPNIVTAFDAGEAAGIHYLAMEYVDGVNLSQAIAQEGPMSIGDATSAIRQAAFALHHAHAAGIIHRDVKPGNLMLSREGTIKLLDLGLARFSHEWHQARHDAGPTNTDSAQPPLKNPRAHQNTDTRGTQGTSNQSASNKPGSSAPYSPAHTQTSPGLNSESGFLLSDSSVKHAGQSKKSSSAFGSLEIITSVKRSFLGTLSFISPEQLEDPESADARSDQYSLGATLFHLLVGHPPFPGEILDQVYGHRHGEIPNLMSYRQDVDLTLANIVTRMLAKDPAARYGSMDEVARAMAPYDNDRSTPAWVLDFSQRKASQEGSTAGDGSRTQITAKNKLINVIGVDLGMLHATTAIGLSNGKVEAGWPVASESGPRSLFRMAVADISGMPGKMDSSTLTRNALFGQAAYDLRKSFSRRVSYCQMMYFGRPDVLRRIAGRDCPPEIGISLCLRHLIGTTLMNHVLAKQADDSDQVTGNRVSSPQTSTAIDLVLGTAWHRHDSWPDTIAITVPSCYDQLHRRSIHSSARLAGFPSARLVDRSVAITRFAYEQDQHGSAAQSKYEARVEHSADNLNDVIQNLDATILYVGLTGQALDVAILRKQNNKIEQIASSGHWCHGAIAWSSRLVDLIVSKLPPRPTPLGIGSDPTALQQDRMIYAAKVQMAGERAMNSLLLLPQTKIEIEHAGHVQSVTVTREQWLDCCSDLLDAIPTAIATACQRANVAPADISRRFVLSPILRLPSIRDRVFSALSENVDIEFFDYTDAARGAVACVAAEGPGNRSELLPVTSRTSHAVGFVVADGRGKRKILPILGRETITPARTNRQLGGRAKDNHLTLALVESSGVRDEAWQTLGRHRIPVNLDEATPTRRLGFEIDINGLLSVHMERPDLGRTVELPALPELAIKPEQWEDWREWVADHA
ncbi:protein kinase domain-containing protein [Neorhodopirellula lusitana]|uniref:protein kinase domain-containing protein n=1 Tax=Neorhodopirellula lusitana TaxID=445327 RepID=UPI0038504D7A